MYCRLYRAIQKELNTFRKLLLSSQVSYEHLVHTKFYSYPYFFLLLLLKVVRISATRGHQCSSQFFKVLISF